MGFICKYALQSRARHHRDGLCGREPGSLGRAAVTARSEGPLPRALPAKAILATPLLLVPQVQGSLCGRSPSRAITCVQGMFLIHIKVKAAASMRQVSFGRTCGPPFIFFFPLPFSCCCSALQNVIRKWAIYKTNVSGRNSPEHPCHKIIEHSVWEHSGSKISSGLTLIHYSVTASAGRWHFTGGTLFPSKRIRSFGCSAQPLVSSSIC